MMMSWLPAAISLVSLLFITIYPLTTQRMASITAELRKQREADGEV